MVPHYIIKAFFEEHAKLQSMPSKNLFGATNIITHYYMPTFNIAEQIYHATGYLLPYKDADCKFLQMYFIGNSSNEVNR